MRIINFAKRNLKEIIRDPLSVVFSLFLPVFLLVIFQQFKIPGDVYKIENFTPGIVIFSFSFITLFTGTLVAKDRVTSLLTRLCASPMKSYEYILGYIIAIIPIIILQNILFFSVALLLGLKFSIGIIWAILISIPIAILFIAVGIIIGCIASENASSGIGSIMIQLVVFTSGMYFDASMVGKVFGIICNILPFKGTLNIIRSILNNNYIFNMDSIIVIVYTIITMIIASILFKKRLESDNK